MLRGGQSLFLSLVCYNKNGGFSFFYIKALVGGVCGYNTKDPKGSTENVPLLSCDRDISNHKSLYKFPGPEDEVELILCLAVKF